MAKLTYYIKKKIGNDICSFSVEGENLHDVVMEANKLSFPDVETCGLCGSRDIFLSAHITPEEGHKYTNIRCKKCGATLNFGQQKKNSDVFYLRTRDEIINNQSVKVYDWKPYNKSN